jgi:ATPase subunit of ABC transporter with duplicated ATPase domains
VLSLEKVGIVKEGEPVEKDLNLDLRRGTHVLLSGPNGIGKSTLLHAIATGEAKHAVLGKNVRIGYYQQDFSMLDFEQKAFDSLWNVMVEKDEQKLRSIAAGFLLGGKELGQQIKYLSEGQKGLLAFARLVLMRPGLLVLDEPTNHINFRHLPLIAQALNEYEGALLMISHIPDFVQRICLDTEIDLAKL